MVLGRGIIMPFCKILTVALELQLLLRAFSKLFHRDVHSFLIFTELKRLAAHRERCPLGRQIHVNGNHFGEI